MPMKKVNVHLSESLLSQLRERSKQSGAPVAELIRRALETYLGDSHANNPRATQGTTSLPP